MEEKKSLKQNKNTESEASSNRKNVENIKKFIVVAFLLMFVLPIMFSFYLMVKVNSLERRMGDLVNSLEKKSQSVAVELSTRSDAESENSKLKAELDGFAYDAIEKTTIEDSNMLANSYEADESELSKDNEDKVISNGKKVYLTFDDGPSHYTDKILSILEEKKVKASFFVVYNDDESLWDEYEKIVEQGHTLAMHSYTHVYDEVYATRESFIYDVVRLHDFLYEQTGVDVKYYRFPGGSSNTVSNVPIQELIGYLHSKGITHYDWNALNNDAVSADMTPEELNEYVLSYIRANEGDSMVLMHDLEAVHATVDALPDLIDTLISEGYEICPIDETTEPFQHVSYDPDYN